MIIKKLKKHAGARDIQTLYWLLQK
jgi:hypothetical protein